MIQNISIENFRCFDKTEMKGFGRINLITGKNNSGKTCLLEALYFCLSQDLEGTIDIRSNESDEKTGDSLMNDKDKRSINFNYLRNTDELGFTFNPIVYSSDFQTGRFTDNKTGQTFIDLNDVQLIFSDDKKYPKNIGLIKKYNSLSLVELFDKAQISGLESKVLEAVKVVDNTITEIRTFGSYPNTLFLKKIDSTAYHPINYYGDAVKKVITYIGTILNYKPIFGRYILIDEIENGIHYTVQKEIWQILFKMCKKFDIQLFATTHSHEMITAFEAVCEEFEGEGAYFEMARHAKTNQIIGIKHEIATLEYELETNTAIRGE